MTELIIIITLIISIIAFYNKSFFSQLQFNPYLVKHKKQWHRTLTHAFLHADWIHLLVNMFVLYFFGREVEKNFSIYLHNKSVLYFIMLYLGAILFSIIITYKKNKNNPDYNAVGASGAVSAIVFSFIIFQPLAKICLYGIICLPGIIWAVIYLLYSYYMSKKALDNINHDAHLLGAIFGIIFTLIAIPNSLNIFLKHLE